MSSNYLISDAAKQVKVEAHVLRYWEEELGLPIKRNELGHRYYTAEDVEQFKEIKDLKERGLQLKAIRMILKNGKLDMLSPGMTASARKLPEEQKEAEEKAVQAVKPTAAKKAETEGQDKKKAQQPVKKNAPVQMASPTEPPAEVQAEEAAPDGIEVMEEAVDIPDSSVITGAQAEKICAAETKEQKAQRLQWLLQQLFRETLQENNKELCQIMKESILKEMDYQFRVQEEREDERHTERVKQEEEHFKRIDELLRKKRRLLKK